MGGRGASAGPAGAAARAAGRMVAPARAATTSPPALGLDGRAVMVDYPELGHHGHPPAGVAGPQAEIEVLGVEAEALVEGSNLLPGGAPDPHRRAGDPGDGPHA